MISKRLHSFKYNHMSDPGAKRRKRDKIRPGLTITPALQYNLSFFLYFIFLRLCVVLNLPTDDVRRALIPILLALNMTHCPQFAHPSFFLSIALSAFLILLMRIHGTEFSPQFELFTRTRESMSSRGRIDSGWSRILRRQDPQLGGGFSS